MKEQFVILEQLLHPVRCCCPGQIHEHMLEFHQGDIWFITKSANSLIVWEGIF